MQTEDALGEVFDALSDPYRRQLLVALLSHNPQDDDDLDPMNVVAERQADAAVLQSELVHVHLPKLDEMGFVEWDRESGEIRTGPNWETIAPVLRLIEDHREELPDEWL